ncbi:LLM class flavin-dependent oxidoreductase [Novosphingobium sp. JCM 18896]|uniref:LLM class flavin-dependent oxidoreductase n=1 Tax=Novosphingobium sp. JCM 18896 TaxID=2989731 RepID=UPI00222312FA|nr:LLM class flavin-dependent oxidoreductase [Novosphingobium sp. JCM 18896]MCW1429785.1 LLM class flavin-dependent oxidoreductase [Novosphingobium sp. JCM 18896]
MGKYIHLVSFQINSPINHTVLSWAAPEDNRLQALGDMSLWIDMAKTLERGLFDAIFFADTPGVFDRYMDRMDDAIRYGVCWPTMDPVTLLGAIAGATSHLGLAATVSTGPHHPYSVVRQLSTLDYMSGGRVGWNIVTGHLRGEHRAYGLKELPHDERYDRAEEYMDICYALWDSVGEGAVIADKASGIFADPSKVKRIEHAGQYFNCNTVAPALPSPQGRPVLFQAGSSGRGQAFAMKHADVVFAIQPNIPGMKKFMDDFRTTAGQLGRTPAPGVTFGIQPVIAGTEEEAKKKLNDIVERIPLEGAIARLSGTMGVDFSGMELDQPLVEMQTQGSQGLMKAFSNIVGDKPLTLRDVAIKWGLAVGMPQLVGSPEQVADQLETIWRETGCHGFNVTPNIMPVSIDDFVNEVVPILQKRGVYPTEYLGKTLRENVELA